MAEDLHIIKGSKEEQYEELIPQIASIISGEDDLTANLGNICAALKEQFNFFWVGFYLIKNDALVLNAFQGPVACTRIKKGRGVCGTAWEKEKVIIVPDVDKFEGHIACSSLSKSEIVLPFYMDNKLIGVFDLDSEHIATFDETDEFYLSKIISLLN